MSGRPSHPPDGSRSSAAASAPPKEAGGACEAVLTLKNRRGLHARASARFVRLAESFDADIHVEKDGVEVCGTSIMGLMLLAAARGDEIRVRARGREARAALDALARLVENRFEEEE